MRKCNIEDSELIAFFDWLSWQQKTNPLLELVHHIANERKCTPAQGARLKRKGVRKGILDVNVPIPNQIYCGLWLEFKKKGEKPTKEQVNIMNLLHGAGHCVRVVYSSDEAIKTLKDYLKNDA